MPVSFDNQKMHDIALPQTVENAVRQYSSWAGIHDVQTLDDFHQSSIALNGWSTNELINNALGDILVEFDIDGPGYALTVRDNGIDYLRFGVDDLGRFFAETQGGTLCVRPLPNRPTHGSVRMAYRQVNNSDKEEDVWDAVTVWVNNRLVASDSYHSGEYMLEAYAVSLSGDGVTATSVRIPQLTDFSEWTSLDPGEFPIGGLSRALEGRYVKYFMRFNGAVRAWKSRPTSPVAEITKDDVIAMSHQFDKRELATHIRLMGAYEWAEHTDETLLARYGHRFREISNPYLMNVVECRKQAEREMSRIEERSSIEQITTHFRPLIEVQDHILTPNGNRIIDSVTTRFQPGMIEASYETRAYKEGN